MFSCLSPGALGLRLDHTAAIDLAVAHGFGGVDPDLGYSRAPMDDGGLEAVAAHGEAVRGKGLQWGMAGLPIGVDSPAEEFRAALGSLPDALGLLTAAGVTAVGTWIRPMHQTRDHAANWRLHAGRLSLVSEILADHGLRLGLEYIGPKTFWSTERHPFVHDITDARALIAETGASNIGLILPPVAASSCDDRRRGHGDPRVRGFVRSARGIPVEDGGIVDDRLGAGEVGRAHGARWLCGLCHRCSPIGSAVPADRVGTHPSVRTRFASIPSTCASRKASTVRYQTSALPRPRIQCPSSGK